MDGKRDWQFCVMFFGIKTLPLVPIWNMKKELHFHVVDFLNYSAYK